MKIFAFQNTPEVVERSSSGGAFMALAEAFFRTCPEARVYGVAMEGTRAFYLSARNLCECRRFQGSKYIRADASPAFPEIASFLENKNPVLFSGTPCGVLALKKYLFSHNIDDRSLFTVDLICHGVGSPVFWSDYVTWLEKRRGSKIASYDFRYKKASWRGYPVRVEFADGTILQDTYEACLFIRAFINQVAIQRGCLQCKLKSIHRHGDITLGDFWGAEHLGLPFEVARGVSLVLENTDKGRQLLEYIHRHMGGPIHLVEIENQSVLAPQTNLFGGDGMPSGYELFWQHYTELGFEKAIRTHGLYTRWGILRYCLIALMKKMGLYPFLKRLKQRRVK